MNAPTAKRMEATKIKPYTFQANLTTFQTLIHEVLGRSWAIPLTIKVRRPATNNSGNLTISSIVSSSARATNVPNHGIPRVNRNPKAIGTKIITTILTAIFWRLFMGLSSPIKLTQVRVGSKARVAETVDWGCDDPR